jgi:protein involved in polysaccharide export with SLBB domain
MKPRRIWFSSVGSVCVAALYLTVRAPAAAQPGEFLAMGDRLKISVFETMEVADPSAAERPRDGAADAILQTFFQRIDLSGEYAVEPGGTISLPLIGSIAVAGRSIATARSELNQAFEKASGRRVSVMVGITQRSPIFVVGNVKTPGSYPYMTSMIVLHAIALAGGHEKAQLSSAQAIELLREQERYDSSRANLKQLLIQKAMLISQRDGSGKSEVPERLQELVGTKEASDLVRHHVELARLETQSQTDARAARLAALQSAAAEIDLLKQRLSRFGAQLSVRSERLRTMETLFARQVVDNERVASVRRDVADMEGRKNEFETTVLQAEARYIVSKQAAGQADQQRLLGLEKQIAQTQAHIETAERGLATSLRAVLLRVGAQCCELPGDQDRAPKGPGVEIVRSGPAGATVILARETDWLEPGDVIRVNDGESSRIPGQQARLSGSSSELGPASQSRPAVE